MLNAFSLQKMGKHVRGIFTRLLLVTMVFSMSGIFSVPTTQAINLLSSPQCFGILFQSTAVPVSGINNSGVIHFDSDAGGLMAPANASVNPSYEACAYNPGGASDYIVNGWAWDDNLGWISFYCNGGTNLGAACGGQNYGVTIDHTTGALKGYAWGDNAGWINFNCTGGVDSLGNACGGFSYKVAPEISDAQCQGYVYSSNLTLAGPPVHVCPAHAGYSNTTAWSDNVGWFDLSGILIPWYALTNGIATPVVTLRNGSNDPNAINRTNAPTANGVNSYTLKVHIQDLNGNNVNPDARYTVSLIPVWEYDTVKRDQIDPNAVFDNKACAGGAAGAVTKSCADMSASNDLAGNYTSTITSVAPTSNMNCWDDASAPGNCAYFYENFVNPAITSPLQSNNIKLKEVDISVFDKIQNFCAWPNVGAASCTAQAVPPTYGAGSYGDDLKFKPATEVKKLQDPNLSDKLIKLSSAGNQLVDFPITVTGSNTVTFYSGINPYSPQQPTEQYALAFDHNTDGNLVYADDVTSVAGPSTAFAIKPQSSVAYSGGSTLKVGIADGLDANSQLLPIDQNITGEYVYSVVSDAANNVKYFSNKLPKNIGSLAATPVAILQGNVYSSGALATTTNAQQAVSSLGNVSTNILRDTIYRNVQSIIAGAPAPTASATVTLAMDAAHKGFQDGTNQIQTFLPDVDGVPQVYYLKGQDLKINASTWTGNRTIIVIGGNVYIQGDLTSSVTPKPQLGIIVLKDLDQSTASQKSKGNVYIKPTVTNIQAHIFADGSVFSDCVAGDCSSGSYGEPIYNTDALAKKDLGYNQLRIIGSIASQNTLGGANIPILGNGTTTTNYMQARAFDLNYLRYYTGLLQYDGSGNATCPGGVVINSDADLSQHILKADGTPWSVDDTNPAGGCLFPPFELDALYHSAFSNTTDQKLNLGSTYVIYDSPSATLPGFTSQTGGQQTQLPQ